MMGRRPASARSALDLMCSEFTRTGCRSPRTIRAYREACNVVIKDLEAAGRDARPWMIRQEDIRYLMDTWQARNLSVATRKHYTTMMNTWMQHYGNDAVVKMRIRWPADMRPNADWITEEQAHALLSLDMTPTQALVVHCELCLGMRRVEVQRLRTDSFKGSYVEILGKGPMGGKPRSMPYHRDTCRILDRFLDFRRSIVAVARSADPDTVDPPTLLIYLKGLKLKEYAAKGTGIDEMLKDLGRAIGVEFSNHTLRRTFGRTMYRSKVPVATISKMLGHESPDQTLRYIGVDMDDMTEAMGVFRLRVVGLKSLGVEII